MTISAFNLIGYDNIQILYLDSSYLDSTRIYFPKSLEYILSLDHHICPSVMTCDKTHRNYFKVFSDTTDELINKLRPNALNLAFYGLEIGDGHFDCNDAQSNNSIAMQDLGYEVISWDQYSGLWNFRMEKTTNDKLGHFIRSVNYCGLFPSLQRAKEFQVFMNEFVYEHRPFYIVKVKSIKIEKR